MPADTLKKIRAAIPPPCVLAQLLVVVLLFLYTVLALASATADDPSRTLHRGNSAEPVTLDPHRSEDVATGNILRDLFEGLTTEDPRGNVIPGSAESWEISADGRTYTFHLRDCLTWSNGEALTAAE